MGDPSGSLRLLRVTKKRSDWATFYPIFSPDRKGPPPRPTCQVNRECDLPTRRHRKMWRSVEMCRNRRNPQMTSIPLPPGYSDSSFLWCAAQPFSRSYSPSGCNRRNRSPTHWLTTSTPHHHPGKTMNSRRRAHKHTYNWKQQHCSQVT